MSQLANRQENQASQPQAVFICNSPQDVYNAIQAAAHWGLQTEQCTLVLKVISDKIQLPPLLEQQVRWKELLRIDPVPVPPRLKAKGFKKRLIQYRFFRDWQKRLQGAIGCRYVFLCRNQQNDNKVIASYLQARELIWLDDGPLAYSLWQEELRIKPSVRAKRAAKAAQASRKITAATKSAQANKKTTAATKSAQANKKTTAATKSAQANKKTTAATKDAKGSATKGSSVVASKKGQKTAAARKKTNQPAIIKSKAKTSTRRRVPAHTSGGKAK